MSVTFSAADLVDEDFPSLEPCLCTQMHEKFSDWLQYGGGDPAEMRAAAHQQCHICRGTGVEGTLRSTLPELNVSNENALDLLRAMGLEPTLEGELDVPGLRRGVMRARARRTLLKERPDWLTGFGKGARFIDLGAGDPMERLNRFAQFLETLAKLGAKKVRWY